MNRVVGVILMIIGLINAIPVVGLASAEVLAKLYGIAMLEGDLLILMRHRALLFGLLGAFIAWSAFKPTLQSYAVVAGLVSMLGFVAIAVAQGEYGAEIRKVVLIDVVASIGLVAVALLRWKQTYRT